MNSEQETLLFISKCVAFPKETYFRGEEVKLFLTNQKNKELLNQFSQFNFQVHLNYRCSEFFRTTK